MARTSNELLVELIADAERARRRHRHDLGLPGEVHEVTPTPKLYVTCPACQTCVQLTQLPLRGTVVSRTCDCCGDTLRIRRA